MIVFIDFASKILSFHRGNSKKTSREKVRFFPAKKRIFISGMNSKVKQVLIALQEDSVVPEMFYENRKDALEATRKFILAAQKN